MLNLFYIIRQNFNLYFAGIIANTCFLNMGWSIVWPSPILLILTSPEQTIFDEPITDIQGSWIVALPSIIGIPGSLVAGNLSDLIGRKYLIMFGQLPRITGWFMTYYAQNVWWLYVARSLIGVSDGFSLTTVPMYIAELAPNNQRAPLGALLQIFSTLGVVSMMCIGPFIDYYTNAIVGIVIAFIPMLMQLVPESPYYYIKKGNLDQALVSLTFVRPSREIAEIDLKILSTRSAEKSFREQFKLLLSNGAAIKGFVLAVILAVCTQIGGFNSITMYLQTIFESTGTNLDSEIASAIMGAVQLCGSISTLLISNVCGRKVILCTSSLIIGFGMIGLGLFFKRTDVDGLDVTGIWQYIPLISFIMVLFSYSAGFGSIIWPLMTELFPENGRPLGVSISTCVLQLSLFVCTKFFAQILNTIGAYTTYVIFGVNNLLICLFILVMVPETKGLCNHDVQNLMSSRCFHMYRKKRDNLEKL